MESTAEIQDRLRAFGQPETRVSQTATYAIGDLHGELTLLQQLLALLPLQPNDRLIFLGDYMDRGEDSLGTVLFLAELAKTRSCIFLRGNHDDAWLEVWDGERFHQKPAIPGAQKIWETTRGQVPAAIGHFLLQTRSSYEDGYAWYAHAGAQPGKFFWETPHEVYMWGWHDFLTTPYSWGKPIIFGHYELGMPLITATKIGLDTAAYRTGILTAMRVEDRTVFQTTRRPIG